MNSLNPLLARFPGLAEKITTSQDDALDLQLEKAASGDWTLKANNLYVHSARDPRKEAERLVNSLDEAGAYIVLGFGLGYAALSLVQKINREPRRPRERLLPFIIIVEKHLSILKRALDLIDLNAVLEYPNLIIIPAAEPSAIVHALDAVNGKDCSRGSRRSRLIPNPTLSKLDAQYYTSIENIIAAYQSKDAVNEATLKKFGALWERNSRKNKAIIEGLLQGIDTLAQTIRPEIQAKNLPFVLLAAGPSLDTIADKMHALAERAVIIAVDTALNFLRQTGVSAHFVLACDGQFWNSKHLERADLSKSILVVEPTVYPSVMRLNAKAIYLSAGEKEKLGQGGSVATSSWDLARLLGAKEIYIAGLDLAYPGYKTHYKAAVFEKMALRSGSRLSPLETKSFQALRGGQPYYATASYTDVVGNNTPGKGKVLTDKRLSLYAAWFENAFSAYPEIKNYSLTQGGLAIAGLEYMDVDAFLAQNNIRVGEADSCVFVVN